MHYNDDESPFEIVMRNPIAKLIYNIFVSFTNINGFYIAYIDELINSNALDLEEIGIEIESCLINLAAAKINPDKKIAPHFKQFKQKVLQDYEEWLTFLKLKTIQAGIPLRAELMDMINLSRKEIGASAEAESLGLNKNHLHPDIYMNEILVSLRSIHQVLSYIMKKMKIYDEFKLDASDHYLDSPKE